MPAVCYSCIKIGEMQALLNERLSSRGQCRHPCHSHVPVRNTTQEAQRQAAQWENSCLTCIHKHARTHTHTRIWLYRDITKTVYTESIKKEGRKDPVHTNHYSRHGKTAMSKTDTVRLSQGLKSLPGKSNIGLGPGGMRWSLMGSDRQCWVR